MTKPTTTIHKVVRKRSLSSSVTELSVEKSRTSFEAGQFFWVQKEEDGEVYKRPYSIASAPWEKEISLCIKAVQKGKVSGKLCDTMPGDELKLLGPMGHFTLPKNISGNLVFVATGTGIAPIRSILRTIFTSEINGKGEASSVKVSLLFGCRRKEDALYYDEFTDLSHKSENFNYHITLSREEGVWKGYVQDHLQKLVDEQSTIFLCGLTPMVQAATEKLLSLGVTQQNIRSERYG